MQHEDKVFENMDYSEKDLSSQVFLNCRFQNCDFTKSKLNNSDFKECCFKGCNLSLAQLNETGFKNVDFEECKLVGVDFGSCNGFLFAVSFQFCQLDFVTFFGRKMKSTTFSESSLKSTDFTAADLSLSIFKNCNLQNAIFERTILEKVDFRTAQNYSFDPELNKIKKAKFSHQGVLGLLNKYNIDID